MECNAKEPVPSGDKTFQWPPPWLVNPAPWNATKAKMVLAELWNVIDTNRDLKATWQAVNGHGDAIDEAWNKKDMAAFSDHVTRCKFAILES